MISWALWSQATINTCQTFSRRKSNPSELTQLSFYSQAVSNGAQQSSLQTLYQSLMPQVIREEFIAQSSKSLTDFSTSRMVIYPQTSLQQCPRRLKLGKNCQNLPQSYSSCYLVTPTAPNRKDSLTLKTAMLNPVISIIKQARIPALWPEGSVLTKTVTYYFLILDQDYYLSFSLFLAPAAIIPKDQMEVA